MKKNTAKEENWKYFYASWIIGLPYIALTIYSHIKYRNFNAEDIIVIPMAFLVAFMMINSACCVIRVRHATSEAIGKIVSIDRPMNTPKKNGKPQKKENGSECIILHISYVVDNQEFHTKTSTTFGPGSTYLPDEYIGKEVSVYYDPRNPENAWPILPKEK